MVGRLFSGACARRLAIAFLIGGAGAHETAVLDLTTWLDQQYERGKLKAESGVHEWYIIRAQIYLEQILEILGYERARKEVLDENVSLMRTLFATAKGQNGEYLRSIDYWRNSCTNLERGSIIHRLAFSLVNQIDRQVSVALRIGQYVDDLLVSARKNSSLNPACIKSVRGLDDIAVLDFTSQFDAHYGELLVRVAEDEVKRYKRLTNRANAMYLEAYAILGRAVSRAQEFQEMVQRRKDPSTKAPGMYDSIVNQSREIEIRIERAQNLRDHVAAQL